MLEFENNQQGQLQQRVANAFCRIEMLERTYEPITIGHLVSKRAETHGSTTALEVFDRDERATYLELDLMSNRHAHALRAFGVRKQDRIGVMLPNCIAFPILWFAIAKLGAVMVPINMRYTQREIEYVLSDTQAKFAVLDHSKRSVFWAMNPWPKSLAKEQVIFVGAAADETAVTLHKLLKGRKDSLVEEDIRPEDLLNIQYTSGTTGFPKGCMLTHDYWGVRSYQAVYGDGHPYRRYLSAQPFFYADPQEHLLRSYRQGGTLYLAPSISSTRFMGWVKQYRIEWCMFHELAARQAEADNENGVTCLKQGLTWGCSPTTQRKLRNRFGLWTQDAYGMTEIGFGTQMPNGLDDMLESASVGLRSPFRKLRVMSEDGTPTPVGEVGELWVSGRGILKGYWNKPEANAASFEGGWFKTGDLLRRDALGFYWLVGRTKDMIRRSSESIAAREVEAVIREIPEIADVAAVPVDDPKRGEEVKIYVELKEGITQNDVPVERILEHARANLAVFKVPRYVAYTPKLPRTSSSNKVLKRELMAVGNPLTGVYDAEDRRWR
ncbi:class I adenylate-forming enzyme family protein [Bradyrhizobium cajani]|uniref:AMP-binding protein n=1 Tax=Bradyrhizobium cajani TaxID=1928661 RepID=A0A844TG43_9BRAD|nr:class I adenylate-forming enzyme family protein [Bradyrhizobium cajani]MCP3368615.1 acyl--CoA ligase [Bradyrhizobium cajani]MVT73590.1 AMP-binding protein [Bradyrhizobium cajani]